MTVDYEYTCHAHNVIMYKLVCASEPRVEVLDLQFSDTIFSSEGQELYLGRRDCDGLPTELVLTCWGMDKLRLRSPRYPMVGGGRGQYVGLPVVDVASEAIREKQVKGWSLLSALILCGSGFSTHCQGVVCLL